MAQRAKYPREVWERAVSELEDHKRSRKDVAAEFGVALHVLDYWRHKVLKKTAQSAVGPRQGAGSGLARRSGSPGRVGVGGCFIAIHGSNASSVRGGADAASSR
jgi:hypothetical protein